MDTLQFFSTSHNRPEQDLHKTSASSGDGDGGFKKRIPKFLVGQKSFLYDTPTQTTHYVNP